MFILAGRLVVVHASAGGRRRVVESSLQALLPVSITAARRQSTEVCVDEQDNREDHQVL